MIEQVAKAKKVADIDAILGKPKPAKRPKPSNRTSRSKLPAVDRTRDTWTTFRAEAVTFADDHPNAPAPTSDQLDMRADLLQTLADAKAGRFKALGPDARLKILDAFDKVAAEAGMLYQWVNGLRGNVLAEALFIPGWGQTPKSLFKGGKRQIGRQPGGFTEPDYAIPGTNFTEWVNLKSDRIDDKPATARAAAKTYLGKATLEAGNLPPGDKYSLDFIRTPPDKETLQDMLETLFSKGSPIYRVKIGAQWYDAKGPVKP